MTPAAQYAVAELVKALHLAATGKQQFLACRASLNTAVEIIGLTDKALDRADVDSVGVLLGKLKGQLETIGAHQSAAGASFSKGTNSVRQAIARLEDGFVP